MENPRCAPLCGASKAYGRFSRPWKHEPECPMRQARIVRVYCGNATRWRGFFEEPEECSFEGDFVMPVDPADDKYATWTCPGCGAVNTVRDHS